MYSTRCDKMRATKKKDEHVKRMNETRLSPIALEGIPTGRRPLGRPTKNRGAAGSLPHRKLNSKNSVKNRKIFKKVEEEEYI